MPKLRVIGPNQTEVEISPDVILFFSYDTCVAACVENKFYRTSTQHSRTTSTHINQWLDGRDASTVPPEFFKEVTKPPVITVWLYDGEFDRLEDLPPGATWKVENSLS